MLSVSMLASAGVLDSRDAVATAGDFHSRDALCLVSSLFWLELIKTCQVRAAG